MALDAVVRPDDEHRVVQRLQGPLGLGGEVDVPGRVKQHEVGARPVQIGLLGEDGDAALALHRIGIEMRIPLVHAPLAADGAGTVEQRLGERGLARVDVGDKTDDGLGHGDSDRSGGGAGSFPL